MTTLGMTTASDARNAAVNSRRRVSNWRTNFSAGRITWSSVGLLSGAIVINVICREKFQKCSRCEGPIFPTEQVLYTNSLTVFHQNCFKCIYCERTLISGDKYHTYASGSTIVCEFDFDNLKQELAGDIQNNSGEIINENLWMGVYELWSLREYFEGPWCQWTGQWEYLSEICKHHNELSVQFFSQFGKWSQ